MKDWHPIIAAVLTVAGGILIVWWQTSQAYHDNRVMLQGFTQAVQDSEQLRNSVLRPLEGRWSYELTWDKYFNQSAGDGDRPALYVSEGTADIRWSGDAYHVLLGYENRDDLSGKLYSVGVSIGTLRTGKSGVPVEGDTILMRYAHRLSVGVVETDDGEVDYSQVPETTYTFRVGGVERNDSGRVSKIFATFTVPISQGTVVFHREQ